MAISKDSEIEHVMAHVFIGIAKSSPMFLKDLADSWKKTAN